MATINDMFGLGLKKEEPAAPVAPVPAAEPVSAPATEPASGEVETPSAEPPKEENKED